MFVTTLRNVLREAGAGRRVFRRGRIRFSTDVVKYRILKWRSLPRHNEVRSVLTRRRSRLYYRLNRGDIQSIREVWLDRCYRVPPMIVPRTIVDLGANIGLTSVWFHEQWPDAKIVAVEPDPDNQVLLRRNFAHNGVDGEVVDAAAGAASGVAGFRRSAESNLGAVGDGPLKVDVMTMRDILARCGGKADLVKMDIEGGEQELLSADDVTWLQNTGAIVAEFHPAVVDYEALIRVLEDNGFLYLSPGSLWPDSMDLFIRPDWFRERNAVTA